MRRFALVFIVLLGCSGPQVSFESTPEAPRYYTRCNLRSLQGEISSINWQAAYLKILPVNTQVQVTKFETDPPVQWHGPIQDFTYPGRIQCFALRDVGSRVTHTTTFEAVPANSEKLFSREPVDLSNWKGEVLDAIRRGVAVRGMPREAVYVALGPPPAILGTDGQKTFTYTLPLGEIMKSQEWYYARKRGNEFLVRFDGENVGGVE